MITEKAEIKEDIARLKDALVLKKGNAILGPKIDTPIKSLLLAAPDFLPHCP